MSTRNRRIAAASLLFLLLSACGGAPDAVMTVEGSYSGTTEAKCQVALRSESTNKLQDSYELEPSFRQDFAIEQGKGQYYVEVHCSDGKMAYSPPFDFDPPRGRISLRNIELH